MNYFQLLDLKQRYDIDSKLLKKQYLNKQALYHPDRASSEELRIKNLNISMQLNEAYKVLKDDYMRAEYLLKILGQKFDDQILNKHLSTDELEEIMDLYEELDEIEELTKLQNLKDKKIVEKTKMVKSLIDSFNKNNIIKALDITVRLKYLTNLVKNIDFKIKNANS